MAKSSYFSNSAKLMAFVAGLLFAANGLSTIGSFSKIETLISLGSSLSSLALYVVLFLGLVALNGEGIGHKRNRDRKSKKVLTLFKLHLLFCFMLNFVKSGMELAAMATTGVWAIVTRLLMSVLSTFSSYGFVLCVVSFWYVIRDRDKKQLLPLEITALVFGVAYNTFKLFNYAIVKYKLHIFGETIHSIFSQNNVLKILCLLQFLFDIAMFVQVCIYYSRLGDEEQRFIDSSTVENTPARNVYKFEGFGIDTMDDDFLSPDTIEE